MTDLIARETQFNSLTAHLRQALAGQLQIVFVTGEAGIGKTALVTSFAEKVPQAVSELLVAGSKCHIIAGGQQEPYLPFVQILEGLVTEAKDNSLTDRLRRIVGEVAPDWMAAIPAIGAPLAAVTRTAQVVRQQFSDHGSAIDTQRRMVQYTNALRQVAKTVPLLLWIDDLHWSDNATLNLISFLADHASDTRIMLIATYRPTDVAHDVQAQPHAVRRLVSKLERHQQCSQVQVQAFTRAQLAEYLRVSSHRLAEPFIDHLWRQSGGNPLFIREYVTWLHMRRLVKRKRGAFEIEHDVQIEIPDTVQAVIEQRLALIGRDLRRLLAYASVQGERFTSRVLTHLLAPQGARHFGSAGHLSEFEVLDKLNQLERDHRLVQEVVRPHGQASRPHPIANVGAQYQFVHALIEQVLYDNLGIAQRRQLHLATAELLEQLHGEEAKRYASDLATHFERGGALTRAIPYYLQASRNDLDVLALDDALAQANAALRLARQMGEDQRATGWEIEALIRMAEVNCWKAEYKDVLAVCDTAEALCQSGSFAQQYAYLLYWRSMALHWIGSLEKSVEPTKQALEILGHDPINRRLQGYLYVRLGRLPNFFSMDKAQEWLSAALLVGEKYDLPDVKVKALTEKAWIATVRRDMYGEALHFALEALTIAQRYKMTYEQAMCHRVLGYTYRRLKHGPQAFSHYQQAVSVAAQSGIPRALHLTLADMAICWYAVCEDWQKGLKIARKTIALAKKYNFRSSRVAGSALFHTTFGLGLWKEANQVQEGYRNSSYVRILGFYHRQQGHLAYARGSFNEAVEEYKRAFFIFKDEGSDEHFAKVVQVHLGLALLRVGDLPPALENLRNSVTYWQNKNDCRFARSLRGVAQAELIQGNGVGAVRHLRQALAAVKGSYPLDAWTDWPLVCIDLGRALLATGETDEALQHALVGYGKFKKWGHFLRGEAAFVVGQILTAQGKPTEALRYLREARSEWERLGLTHHLPAWQRFMREQALEPL